MCRGNAVQVNEILQSRNEQLEEYMAAEAEGFLASAAAEEGAVQTYRYFSLLFVQERMTHASLRPYITFFFLRATDAPIGSVFANASPPHAHVDVFFFVFPRR